MLSKLGQGRGWGRREGWGRGMRAAGRCQGRDGRSRLGRGPPPAATSWRSVSPRCQRDAQQQQLVDPRPSSNPHPPPHTISPKDVVHSPHARPGQRDDPLPGRRLQGRAQARQGRQRVQAQALDRPAHGPARRPGQEVRPARSPPSPRLLATRRPSLQSQRARAGRCQLSCAPVELTPRRRSSRVPAAPRRLALRVPRLDRSAQPPWTPSLSLAFRMIIFVRFTAAIYTGITDCDEGASLSSPWAEPLPVLEAAPG